MAEDHQGIGLDGFTDDGGQALQGHQLVARRVPQADARVENLQGGGVDQRDEDF